MIIDTGGAGFIGSNLVHELNAQGRDDVLVVDNLSEAINAHKKFSNLAGARLVDYMDNAEFRKALDGGAFDKSCIEAIFHQGACWNTLEDDGRYIINNNFKCSKEVLHFALQHSIPLIYGSTAATSE